MKLTSTALKIVTGFFACYSLVASATSLSKISITNNSNDVVIATMYCNNANFDEQGTAGFSLTPGNSIENVNLFHCGTNDGRLSDDVYVGIFHTTENPKNPLASRVIDLQRPFCAPVKVKYLDSTQSIVLNQNNECIV